jgi:hypothetical protein
MPTILGPHKKHPLPATRGQCCEINQEWRAESERDVAAARERGEASEGRWRTRERWRRNGTRKRDGDAMAIRPWVTMGMGSWEAEQEEQLNKGEKTMVAL